MKKYELPSQRPSAKSRDEQAGSWLGTKKQPQDKEESRSGSTSGPAGEPSSGVLQGISRMGNWGFGGMSKPGPAEGDQSDEEDDRRIRFTIGGAGRRLTKEDFIREIQSLDSKARAEILDNSDAPAAMKDMAKKDASKDAPGSSRLLSAQNAQASASQKEAKTVGAEMARRRGADVDTDASENYSSDSDRPTPTRTSRGASKVPPPSSRRLSKVDSPSHDVPETAAERRRREQVLRGVEEGASGRGRGRSPGDDSHVDETPAERRRREAALGAGGAEEDSDDDDTPRVPTAAKSRGIRFAQSPVRGRK